MNRDDDFFETPRTRRRATWVVVAFGVVTLLVVALPLIAAFTGWL
jgi:hypothetical protein